LNLLAKIAALVAKDAIGTGYVSICQFVVG
jgi:hypothetical protein